MKISGIGFVYMITNPTGRLYVGSTNDFDSRINYYKLYSCKGQRKLYNSFIKYGVEHHIFEIIWAGDISEMLKYETLIGWGFNVLEKEHLNLKLPKLGDTYKVISEETRRKMSISIKNAYTEDRKKLQSESMKGEKHFLFGKPGPMTNKKHTIKTKLKISITNKNRIGDWRNKLSESHKGKKCSDETKFKMSIAAKGKIRSKEHQAKLNISMIGRTISKEQIEKLRVSNIGRRHSQEEKDKRANSNKKPIIQYDLQNNFIKEWMGAIDIQKELGLHIRQCLSGRNKKCGNYKWKYKN